MKAWFLFLLGVIMMIGIPMGLAIGSDVWACHAKWDDAGFEAVRFDLPGGCKIKKHGAWLPTSAIRNLD